MPFIPHTPDDVSSMLKAIDIAEINQLFDEIPEGLQQSDFAAIPDALSELAVTKLLHQRAAQDQPLLSFVGAGAYEHHIPAAVWEITTRGEYYSAYTPYQAEASQGTLQLLYEFQTMICNLTGMEAANASLYEGASALAEAVLMAVRCQKKSKRILVPRCVNPIYREVVETIVRHQGITLELIDYDPEVGNTDLEALSRHTEPFAALLVPQPNFFGVLECADELTDWAHQNNGLVIGLVNPTALALLKPPGEWGSAGADIVCGEGQPLGIPLASGGPYFGFMACKQKLVRQMPGRIIGRTVDLSGNPGFTLTLQAREQHIRRAKATSNICTNQGLMVTAATIYMSILGSSGLRSVATVSHNNLQYCLSKFQDVKNVASRFSGPVFHEAVITLSEGSAEEVLDELLKSGIHGGYALKSHYPELGESFLICTTETKDYSDINVYAAQLETVLANS